MLLKLITIGELTGAGPMILTPCPYDPINGSRHATFDKQIELLDPLGTQKDRQLLNVIEKYRSYDRTTALVGTGRGRG